MNGDDQKKLLEILSAILLRCFFFSLLLLYVWFALYLFSGGLGYAFLGRWFPLTKQDYDWLNCFGLALTKIIAIVFFLVPYLSIRWVLRKKKL